jgi:hypothetical protein
MNAPTGDAIDEQTIRPRARPAVATKKQHGMTSWSFSGVADLHNDNAAGAAMKRVDRSSPVDLRQDREVSLRGRGQT